MTLFPLWLNTEYIIGWKTRRSAIADCKASMPKNQLDSFTVEYPGFGGRGHWGSPAGSRVVGLGCKAPRKFAQKQTKTVGLVQSWDIIIHQDVWPRWSGTPTPPPFLFSSDFGNSHDPGGLGLGGVCPQWLGYCSFSHFSRTSTLVIDR